MSTDLQKRCKQHSFNQKTIYCRIFTRRPCLYALAFVVNPIIARHSYAVQKPIFSAAQPYKGKTLDLNLQPLVNNNKPIQALLPESHAKKFYKDEQIDKKSKKAVIVHMSPHQKIQPFENPGNAGSPLHILQNASRPYDAINPKQLIEQPPSIRLKKAI